MKFFEKIDLGMAPEEGEKAIEKLDRFWSMFKSLAEYESFDKNEFFHYFVIYKCIISLENRGYTYFQIKDFMNEVYEETATLSCAHAIRTAIEEEKERKAQEGNNEPTTP